MKNGGTASAANLERPFKTYNRVKDYLHASYHIEEN